MGLRCTEVITRVLLPSPQDKHSLAHLLVLEGG